MQVSLSLGAEYALRSVVCVAQANGARVSRGEIAHATSAPPAYLSKVLRKLVAAGLLEASTGRGGGFVLARPPDRIRFLDVIQAIDPPAAQVCAFGRASCEPGRPCPLHPFAHDLRSRLADWAARTTLADVTRLQSGA